MRKFMLFLALGASGFAGAACSAQTNAQNANQAAPAARPMPPRGGPMMRADTNGDGQISRAEFVAEADARFQQMDADHDGTLTRDEMKAFRQAMHDRMVANGGRGDMPPPPPPGGKPPKDKADGGSDGAGRTITRADFTNRAAARFDRMDTNHDGTLDQAERDAARPKRGGRGGHGGHHMRGGEMPPPPPANAQAPDTE